LDCLFEEGVYVVFEFVILEGSDCVVLVYIRVCVHYLQGIVLEEHAGFGLTRTKLKLFHLLLVDVGFLALLKGGSNCVIGYSLIAEVRAEEEAFVL